jgi:predicted transcriptional regulator
MQRERQNKQNKPGKEKKEGYIIVTNYFLKKWVRILGVGPVVLYEELLTYCHKGKYIAWPTINTLCQEMGIAKTTLLRYQNTLLRFGLIKNVTRGKSTTGHYRNNIYQITSIEELSKHPDPDKIIDFVGSKMKPDRYQNDTSIGSNMKLSLVSKRYPNNNNLNSTNITATNRENAAANFKKLREKGEEKMQAIKRKEKKRCRQLENS